MRLIQARLLTKAAFRQFGDVIDKDCEEKFSINKGKCIRHHDLAKIELSGENAKAIISIFEGQPYALPHKLDLVERHPLGSQAFVPMHDRPFLVIVCDDKNGTPINPQAFVTKPGQGINLKKNVWHGVLTPLYKAGDFLVVDRDGDGDNLEEFEITEPYTIEVEETLFKN